MLRHIKPKGSFLLSARFKQQQVFYHYDKDVHGYRTPRPFELPAYTQEELDNRNKNSQLLRLVRSFRNHGHRAADLDPLELTPKETIVELDPKFYGISEGDDKSYNLSGILHVPVKGYASESRENAKIKTILNQLRKTYAGRIGFEFEHIPNSSERRWVSKYIESFERTPLTSEQKKKVFELLTKSEVFDHFMAKKFPQVKRYGLEGAESMMVALDELFKVSNNAGIRDIILCMPHRGRLNLLTGALKFPCSQLFHKVKGNAEFPENVPGIGDVISHLATTVELDYKVDKPIKVSLLHNPSHLEAVNPVAMGKARARQMSLFDGGTEAADCMLGDRVLCVQLHGDAAFTGQGVVTETLGLSNLPHFTSGGSVHVIVNNQIGYTTPAMNARSTVYTSDVGKMINAPVIHVNADYPEDVTYAMTLAFEYRNKFRKDVIVDLIAYRRWGHNELDEPAFTQPGMYNNIRSRKSVPKLYEEKLIAEGVISPTEIEEFRTRCFTELEQELEKSYSHKPKLDSMTGKWKNMVVPTTVQQDVVTGVELDVLKEVGFKSVEAPSNFKLHARLKKYHIDNRVARVNEGAKLDWATAEAMAFGSLLLDGYHVRISGQDVGRGTFSQRHMMLVDQKNERTIIPLNRLTRKTNTKQGKLEIANSSLSEFAVLGFETGVSWETPNRLCIWEAQFGDFFNGAQIIIDTYLSSGEAKWFRQSGLVMLLPHGYDGAGPEHSSCRVERFLQLCDQKFDVLNDKIPDNPNMHVVNPTTPAQYFHVLRRQMLRSYRKPLIVVGPKILLRHPQATSSLSEMQPGTKFLPVLGDSGITNPATVERVMFISGKLYYDLVAKRAALNMNEKVAIVRVEELCPFPLAELKSEVARYSNAKDFYWVQEEPQNQGAFTFIEPRLNQILSKNLVYVGRRPLCAPASGVSSSHKVDQAKILSDAFKGL